MALPGQIPAIIIAALIIVFAIIHFGVGVGIVARYHQYDDVFRQSVGLAAFNIVISVYSFVVGVVGLIAVVQLRPTLGKYLC
jgi:hypothetical protein